MTNRNPFERLRHYTDADPTNPGGVRIDIQALTEDLVAAAKIGGFDLETALFNVRDTWDKIDIEVGPRGQLQ